MVTEANSLDDLAKKDFKTEDLTTGDVALILQLSQQHIIRLCDKGWLEHSKVLGSKHRRIQVEQLVRFVQSRWDDLKTCYPQQQLLHFMEVVGLSPESYDLNGLAGQDGLRFHTQQLLYSTGEVKDLMHLSYQTIIRSVDRGILEGYKLPNSDDRRVLSSAVARYVRDNKIRLEENVKIAASPAIVTFPDAYSGYKEGPAEWEGGTKVAYNNEQSVWYRNLGEADEVSIRRDNNYGAYLKWIELEPIPRIDLILLDEANRNSDGGILAREEHLKRVYELLELGKAQEALDVVEKSQSRLEEVYPEIKEIIREIS